ncbi:unnamed protein product, partial [Meganyctiphanes norvegica]
MKEDYHSKNKTSAPPPLMQIARSRSDIITTKTTSINRAGCYCETPLWEASNNNNSEIVQILLANNVDVNKADKWGRTPLYIASEEGHSKIAQLLLANNADVNKAEENVLQSM